MTVLRFLAGLFLMAAIIALVSDATRPMLGMGPLVPTSLGKLWADTAPRSLAAVRQALPPFLWASIAATVLRLPTFLLLGLIGLLFGYLGRRRSRVDIYIN